MPMNPKEHVDLLSRIWCADVAKNYNAGAITTERCLQAALYSLLRGQGPSQLEVFVEPVLLYYENGSPRLRPDLVLAEDDVITVVCELKFVPHWYPKHEDDLLKLRGLSSGGMNAIYPLRMNPRTGYIEDLNRHRLAVETQYVLMVVGQADAAAVWRDCLERRVEDFPRNFTLMYGRISSDTDPEFGVE